MFPLNELKNFFIYFIFRKKILVDIKFYFLILYRKLFYNIRRNSYHYYPKNIRSHLSNIKFDNYNYIQKQKRIKK